MEIDKEFKDMLEIQLDKTLEKIRISDLENRREQTKLKNLRDQRDAINKMLGKGKGRPGEKKKTKEPTEVEQDENGNPFGSNN